MSRDQMEAAGTLEMMIREAAYYLWLAEECPEGRADDHWYCAQAMVTTRIEEHRKKANNAGAHGFRSPLSLTESYAKVLRLGGTAIAAAANSWRASSFANFWKRLPGMRGLTPTSAR